MTSPVILAIAGTHPPPTRLPLEPGIAHAYSMSAVTRSAIRTLRWVMCVVRSNSYIGPGRPVRASHEAAVGPCPSRVAAALSRGGGAVGGGLAGAVSAAEVWRAGLTSNKIGLGCCAKPEHQQCGRCRHPSWHHHVLRGALNARRDKARAHPSHSAVCFCCLVRRSLDGGGAYLHSATASVVQKLQQSACLVMVDGDVVRTETCFTVSSEYPRKCPTSKISNNIQNPTSLRSTYDRCGRNTKRTANVRIMHYCCAAGHGLFRVCTQE